MAFPPGAEDDSEVVRILDAYLSGIEAGQPADPDKLLADHPALAGQLRAYLMHGYGRPRGGGSPPRAGLSPAGSARDDLRSRVRSAAPSTCSS